MAAINYNHLRYFWAVAHDGNLTRTAARLNVSQSALSLQIKKLEERLGHQLFERRGRQLVLTEAGTVALGHADTIFHAGEELLDTLLDRETGGDRALRIGALSTLSRNFQLSFLRPLLEAGDTRVHVRSGSLGELVALLQGQKLDVVLTDQTPARTTETPWIAHALASQGVSLVGQPGMGLAGISLAQLLAGHPLILPSKESSIRLGFDALADELGVRPQVRAEVDDMALLRVLVKEGAGLAVVPPIVVTDELKSGELVEICTLPKLTETFHALTMPRRFPNPVLRQVLKSA